eukprot:CAMPEP_0202906086 /NCGR_PEP_ID=MMETSP1392-20130828/37260_1 /ASSEMBLY_ACC=CAM_ASM_000868 /TAXON_ID=225041 /ORGANISM="Chlamydomonas chlamydogama, Strain SAG 11-48b" /LENGTH=83 /DNA_ID=CAMNT_0049594445 /DNA_START=902 /DNA_END=1153 /DNA_ORIENTATION=-
MLQHDPAHLRLATCSRHTQHHAACCIGNPALDVLVAGRGAAGRSKEPAAHAILPMRCSSTQQAGGQVQVCPVMLQEAKALVLT